MDEEQLKLLYDNYAKDKGFNDYNEFKNLISNNESRKVFFDNTNSELGFKDISEFDNLIGLGKKKAMSVPSFSTNLGDFTKPLPSASEQTLPLASNLQSKSAKTEPQKIDKTPVARIGLYSNTLQSIRKRNSDNLLLAEQYRQQGDEEGMRTVLGQIDQDQRKIDILSKGIEAQKQQAQIDEPNTIGNNLLMGGQQALGLLARGVTSLDESLNIIKKDLWASVGLAPSKEAEESYAKFLERSKGSFKQPSDFIAETGKELIKAADTKAQTKNIGLENGGSAWEALKEGKVSQAADYGFKGFVSSLPTSTLYLNPLTAATVSSGMVGNQLDESMVEKGSVNSNDLLAGTIKASLELVTERMFGAGKATKELITKFGKEAAEQMAKETSQEMLKKTLISKLGKNTAEEITGEVVNQFGSNIVDKYMLDKKDVGVLDGVGDAAIIALFAGGGQGGVSTTLNHYIDKKQTAKYEENKAKADNLMEQSLNAESEVVASALEKRAEELNTEAEKVAAEQNKIGEFAEKETVAQINTTNKEIDELQQAKVQLEQIGDTEAVIAIDTQLEEKEKLLEKTIKQAKKEADLNFENENKPIEEIENALIEQNSENKVENLALNEQKTETKPNEEKTNTTDSGLGNDNIEPIVNNARNNENIAVENVSLTDKGNKVETVENIEEVQTEKPIVAEKGVVTPSSDNSSKVSALGSVKEESKSIKNKDWFHGSENEFSEFENKNPNITGFWFSDSKENAATYGDKIKSVKLNIDNPLIIDAKGKKFTDDIEVEVLAKYPNEEPYLTKIGLDMDEIVWMIKNGKRKNSFIEIPDHSKYDAVVFKNIIDPSLSSKSEIPQTSIAVIDKAKIKQSTNKQNDTNTTSNIPTSDKGTQGAEPIIKEGEAKVEGEQNKETLKRDTLVNDVSTYNKLTKSAKNTSKGRKMLKDIQDRASSLELTTNDNKGKLEVLNTNGKKLVKSRKVEEVAEPTTEARDNFKNLVEQGVITDSISSDILEPTQIKAALEAFKQGKETKDVKRLMNEFANVNEDTEIKYKDYDTATKQWVLNSIVLSDLLEQEPTLEGLSQKEIDDLSDAFDMAYADIDNETLTQLNNLFNDENQTNEQGNQGENNVSDKGSGKEKNPTKAEKIASAEKSINDIRNKLKEKFKIYLPEGTKTAGFTMNDLIDLVADTAIQLAKTGIEINEAVKQAIQFLKDEGDLEGFDEAELESKVADAVKPKTTDVKEEIRLENKEADKKGRSTSEWLSSFREQVVTPKELTDLLDEMNISKTIITNKKTIEQAQRILDSYQADYDSGENTKDPINRVIDEVKKGDLPTAVGQVVIQILFKNTAKEISKALKEGDRQKANFFFDLQAKIVESYSEQGTDAGRALQVRKMFMDYVLNDPDLADYYYRKQVQNSNKEARKDKTNIESATEIQDKVETAKKKAIKKVAGKVVADLDAQIEAEITRAGGIGKNATEAKKKQVDAYFDKLVAKFDNKQTYSTIIPITPAVMVKMINAVRELVKGGIDLQAAISKVSADLIRNGEATPKETAAMKENLNGARKELKTPKEKTPEQIEREEANAELKAAKKEYNDKQKELKKAQLEAAKASEENKKEAQKVVDKLTKEVISTAKRSDQNAIEDIIQAFYSKEEQVQSDLEKMVIEALNVTEKEAVKIAESIKNQMETELRSKLIKDFEKITKLDEEKNKKAATSEYVGNFIKGLTVSKPKKNTIVDKMLQLSMMGVLKTDDIMDLMKNKYGITEFTFDMSNYIKEQARKINEADTQGRKNKEMAKMTDKMAELAPLYYNEAMNSLWYGAILSGFGTQDANITFNAEQVVNSFYRSLALTLFNNLKNKGTALEKMQSIGKDLYQMFFRTLYQATSEGKIAAPRKLFSSTLTNLTYGIKEGVSSFAETQKALESQSQSEMDYSRYAKWMKFLNNFKYVGRALSAMDLATQDLIKNSWIIPVLRDIYGKEGLSPKAIDAKIQQELASNLNEIEAAKNQAINDILRYDISVKKVGDKYHVMYENKIVFRTDTEQEANDKKLEAAEKQTTAINRFAYERLQTKINEQALRSATHLSQETIMSAAPSGFLTSGLYNSIINLKNTMSKYAEKQEKEARASNKPLTKIRKGQIARLTYAVARIVPFVKMAINLAENFFIKDNPLGYVRAVWIEKAIANPKDKAEERLADFYQSQTQINDLKARAIIGTLWWAIPLLLTTLMGDDEEEKEGYLKVETANEIAELKELEESTGQPMEEGNPYLLVPKDGEVFGSLDFMQPQTKKALENAGLAKEHSYYKGTFPNGKFVSIVSDPSKFNYVNTVTSTVAMINKYVVNNKFDKLSDEDKKNRIEQVILNATLYSLMSFGSFSITKRSKNLIDLARQGKTLDAFAQVAEGVIPEFAVVNPAILRQTLRYIDGTAREFASPSNDFTTYLGTKIPLLGSFISVYGVEKRRGMFGEEMYSVPAMQQGGMSSTYYDMRFGDKNKPEKEMYQFLASKGYNKVKSMPSTLSIMSIDGKTETPITEAERNKLGAEAGQKVLKRLQSEKEYLSKLPNSIVNRYVDKLFNMEFKNTWLVYKGVYKEKQIKERNEKFLESMKTAIEKQKEIAKRDKENKVTPEMKAFRRSVPKNAYDKKLFLVRNLKDLTEEQQKATIKEWVQGGVIENDTEYIEEIRKLAVEK